jgi:hypothetical protein
MTKSTTKSHTRQTITQRIDRLLDFTPDIKIRKLEQGKVQVNDILIYNEHGSWICTDKSFYRRKSAVGYALCLINNDYKKANKIKELDSQLQKHKIDIDFYHYHLRNTKTQYKITFSNRISADMPLLYDADSKLTQLLKTVEL